MVLNKPIFYIVDVFAEEKYSGNQLAVFRLKKELHEKEMQQIAREMNFFIIGSFILGAPIETKKHVENTIKFSRSLPIDLANFAPLVYLRGSDLWSEAVENKIISENEDAVLPDINNDLGNFTKEEILNYTIEAFNSFYFRPNYLVGQFFKSLLRKDYSLIVNGLKYFNLFNRISDDGKQILKGEKSIS